MVKLFAIVWKELLLIGRDRAGLLLLFAMPAALVLVVSLVQNNILETSNASVQLLLVDEDQGEIAAILQKRLRGLGSLSIVNELDGRLADATAAREAVMAGDFQFAVVIPAGTTAAVQSRARQLAEASFRAEGEPASPGSTGELAIYFDPTVQGAFRTAVVSSLRLVLLGIETEEKTRLLAELLPQEMKKGIAARLPFPLPDTFELPLHFAWNDQAVFALREEVALAGDLPQLPTAVQQNVPAWALFGMFFIVVPLSGTLLRERQEGTLQRLRTLPVSPLLLLAGKIAAYVLICLGQFAFMLLVGKYLLPLFGTPVLEIGRHPAAVFTLALAAALAATGFGMLVGTLVGSYEQSSMVGPVAVVLAAAIGGIMVPVYVMPKAMAAVSVYSPLAWGLNGFIEIFVRGGDTAAVLPNILSLLAFFAANLGIACLVFLRRSRGG